MVLTRRAHMLLACAIQYLKALTDDILVLKLSRSGFLGISLIFLQ